MSQLSQRTSLLILFFLLAGAIEARNKSYGDQVSDNKGFPSWLERQVLVLTNAVRIAPVEYRNVFIGAYDSILVPDNYPSVSPVYWNLPLNRSSRDHAIDMAENCGLQHESCDGTDAFERIKRYYSASGNLAENISFGEPEPVGVLRQWLIDSSDPNNIPLDKSGKDGHRVNIMSSAYHEMGIGYALGPAEQWFPEGVPFWVQDFGGAASQYDANPIPGGSHFFFDSGKVTFLVTFFDKAANTPQETILMLDNTAYTMTVALGSPSKGTYRLDLSRATECRPYYFLFSDGINEWRYPELGLLITQGEGNCSSDYLEQQVYTVKTTPSEKVPKKMVGTPGRVLFIDRGRKPVISAEGYVDLRGSKLRQGVSLCGQVLIRR